MPPSISFSRSNDYLELLSSTLSSVEMHLSILGTVLLTALRFSQASTLSSPAKRQSGGFQNSCIDLTLVHDSQGYFLDAQCNNNAGSRVGASIKLGNCLTNNNGQLAYEVK